MTFMHEAKATKQSRTVHNPKKSIAGNDRFIQYQMRILNRKIG